MSEPSTAEIRELFDRGAKGWALDSHEALGVLLRRLDVAETNYQKAIHLLASTGVALEAAEQTIKEISELINSNMIEGKLMVFHDGTTAVSTVRIRAILEDK